jgi:transcriptional regulator with XRE-family HTH domain
MTNGKRVPAAKKCRSWREERGVKQCWLADHVGMPRGALCTFERDSRSVPLKYITKLSELTGIPALDFVTVERARLIRSLTAGMSPKEMSA